MGLFDGAGKDAVEKAGPILHEVENRLGGILHGLLDRLNGTKLEITVTIPPVPKPSE